MNFNPELGAGKHQDAPWGTRSTAEHLRSPSAAPDQLLAAEDPGVHRSQVFQALYRFVGNQRAVPHFLRKDASNMSI
ncbi:hypothetical protein NHX12_005984 [Muraenolepis orangiensis]|uniref:Uncharacterized protein n=1 Tax=Muraenolepis orangiensis TaxID=630683 RepID=A0A9Q0ICN9_9TELE|nr:hypothetical protein NHX12_005984 [Muraenolepis orangiensis]